MRNQYIKWPIIDWFWAISKNKAFPLAAPNNILILVNEFWGRAKESNWGGQRVLQNNKKMTLTDSKVLEGTAVGRIFSIKVYSCYIQQ